jgi:hypothetical protein
MASPAELGFGVISRLGAAEGAAVTEAIALEETAEALRPFDESDAGQSAFTGFLLDTDAFVIPFLAGLRVALPFLAFAWLAGVIVFLSVSLASYAKVRQFLLIGSKPLGVASRCRVVMSPLASTPMILGVAKPVVILPAQAYSDSALEMALAHELAHFRRRDTLVKLVLLLARAIHWFNPLVHFMARDIEELCETSCDECVVSRMSKAERKLYGELILSTLESGALSRAALAAGMGSAGKSVKRRLIKMMNYKKTKKRIVALSIALALILGASGVALAYALPDGIDLTLDSTGAELQTVAIAVPFSEEGVVASAGGWDVDQDSDAELPPVAIDIPFSEGLPLGFGGWDVDRDSDAELPPVAIAVPSSEGLPLGVGGWDVDRDSDVELPADR